MHGIELATVLPGAQRLPGKTFNDSFKGLVLLADQSVHTAYIKDLDVKQLANELLALVLAKEIGMPIPDGYLAAVKSSDLTVQKAPYLGGDRRLVYASKSVKTPDLSFRISQQLPISDKLAIIRELISWVSLGNLYAFDAWIANVDRHPGNLLFGGANEVWLIDHGHCFSGESWQPADLDPTKYYRHRLSEWLTVLMDDNDKQACRKVSQNLQTVIDAIDVSLASVHAKLGGLLSDPTAEALVAFLEDRKTYVDEHAKLALAMLI